jgi:hypothetical protein
MEGYIADQFDYLARTVLIRIRSPIVEEATPKGQWVVARYNDGESRRMCNDVTLRMINGEWWI